MEGGSPLWLARRERVSQLTRAACRFFAPSENRRRTGEVGLSLGCPISARSPLYDERCSPSSTCVFPGTSDRRRPLFRAGFVVGVPLLPSPVTAAAAGVGVPGIPVVSCLTQMPEIHPAGRRRGGCCTGSRLSSHVTSALLAHSPLPSLSSCGAAVCPSREIHARNGRAGIFIDKTSKFWD